MSEILRISEGLKRLLDSQKAGIRERPKPLTTAEFQAKVEEWRRTPIQITTPAMLAYLERMKAEQQSVEGESP